MDPSKYHSVRADILAFPHMSRKDEQLLQTVLNNMSQGVLMFDQETRLIFCNKRYIELYGLSAEIVKSGCLLRDLLKHRMELGSFSGDADEYIARLKEGIAEGKTFNQGRESCPTDGRFRSSTSPSRAAAGSQPMKT